MKLTTESDCENSGKSFLPVPGITVEELKAS